MRNARLRVAATLLVALLAALPAEADPPPVEAAYQKARRAYYTFRASPKQKKFRHHWQQVARKFELVAETFPESERAADALFTAGRLYYDLYAISRLPDDLQRALQHFGRLVEKFPLSHLADDAQLYVATGWLEYRKDRERARRELEFLVNAFPRGDVTPAAQRMLEDLSEPPLVAIAPCAGEPDGGAGDVGPAPAGDSSAGAATADGGVTDGSAGGEAKPTVAAALEEKAVLEAVRHWSSPEYSRVALYTRVPVKFRVGRLPAEAAKKVPERLFVDLPDCELGDEVPLRIDVSDSVVHRIRVAEREEGFIRVVVEAKGEFSHKVVPLQNPERLVIDLTRQAEAPASGQAEARDEVARIIASKKSLKEKRREIEQLKKKSRPEISLSAMAGLHIRRVVIDAGHGGRDPGAIGPGGTLEKNVALDIATELGRKLQEELKLEVIYTREKDEFLALEARTALANEKQADLFVSVHLNANVDRKLSGVEVFYLDLTNDRYSIKLAARENATSEKNISDLKFILADLALKSHTDDSIRLAEYVQQELVGALREKYQPVRSHGVKAALFYVLIGARMPSILVEASFITNRREEKRLQDKAYRAQVAEGIFRGIKRFIEEREQLLEPG